MKLSEM